MQISQTKEQIAALSAFQQHCEIESITLQNCSAVRAKSGTSFKAPFTAKPVLSNVSSIMRDGTLTAEVSFEYSAWDSSEPPERVFLVNCVFEASYRLIDGYGPSADEISSFTKGTAVFNCWPYAREFMRDITARLGHTAPALPLLRIVPKRPEAQPPQEAPKLKEPAIDNQKKLDT